MNGEQEALFYDVSAAVSRPITVAEWDALCAMFASDGWRVWMSLKEGDLLDAIADCGVIGATESAQAAYTSLILDVTAEERLREVVASQEPAPKNAEDREVVDFEKGWLTRKMQGIRARSTSKI